MITIKERKKAGKEFRKTVSRSELVTLTGGHKDAIEKMTPDMILTMDWLNENIEGDLLRHYYHE